MAKSKQIQQKIKDHKKVAAGKARAAKSIRIAGRYASRDFIEKVKEDAETVGAKDPFQFYLQNQNQYEDIYREDMLTTNREFHNIKKEIANYKGKIFKNGKQVKKSTAIKAINSLNQYLKSEHDIVAWWEKISLSLSGTLKFELPSVADIEKEIEEGGEIEDVLEGYGITAIASNPKENKVHFVVSKKSRLTACKRDKSKVQYTYIKKEVTCLHCRKNL